MRSTFNAACRNERLTGDLHGVPNWGNTPTQRCWNRARTDFKEEAGLADIAATTAGARAQPQMRFKIGTPGVSLYPGTGKHWW